MENPLLKPFDSLHELPPFDQIRPEHYLPAIQASIEESRSEIEQIINNEEAPDFQNTIEALEYTGERLGLVSSILFNLNSAETNDDIQQIAQEASPLLTEFQNWVSQNTALYRRIEKVHAQMDQLDLNPEQSMLLDKTYKGFVRSGASLEGERRQRYAQITIELSKLGLQFGQNVLAETNAYELLIEDEQRLAGLPEDVRERARSLAKSKGKEGWIFNLQAPSYIPFMEHCDDRELRETLYRAYMTKSNKDNEHDNKALIGRIVSLRHEKAKILGYPDYASYVLEERMAKSPDKVIGFLEDLLDRALPKAKEELEEVRLWMKEKGVTHELERWDWAYYEEKFRKDKYAFDEERVKPFFKLESVIEGVFTTAEKLYGLRFRANDQLEKYHPDVKGYEVLNENGQLQAVFLTDFFPRDGKRGGAWMTSYRDRKVLPDGTEVIPHISIVCNFTPSSATRPSLLKFDEVKTLFHEFGHALHGMLASTQYPSLAGTHVYWDFVELPSQIMENWCYEPECLALFAKHYETGELIPDEFVEKLRTTANFHEAYRTVRQISFGLLDFAYHHQLSETVDPILIEEKSMERTELFPKVKGINMSVQFSHIFAGGYAAGYYSYKWAEVLDADAFAYIKSKGVFNEELATSFKENILSKGGTEHPLTLYKRFRGQEPTPDALIERAGLN